ncbi:MAG: hypothetical protein EOO01_34840, partial [Chitinophagaceae bacterium]
MIIALVIWLLRKIRPASKMHGRKSLVVIVLLVCCVAKSQEHEKLYSVMYKGDDIGTVRLKQSNSSDTFHYRIISDINTRFIVKICVKSVEESVFKNDRLIYSTVNRTVNG